MVTKNTSCDEFNLLFLTLSVKPKRDLLTLQIVRIDRPSLSDSSILAHHQSMTKVQPSSCFVILFCLTKKQLKAVFRIGGNDRTRTGNLFRDKEMI